ncbi:unnamed protein product [Brassica rapa subsp. trilocularis]
MVEEKMRIPIAQEVSDTVVSQPEENKEEIVVEEEEEEASDNGLKLEKEREVERT